ncbi:hypothetical protein BD289DRAFT_479399 [Coniella lustricola]|uniref:Uncharacterized protein n=1 Tax=Coniella lustricola TaxID=2025994 RepID=A0A2T3AJH6_9PEZI|nr:hypothetical protein BD289DRAFT_479399 [Coniella lustricola]
MSGSSAATAPAPASQKNIKSVLNTKPLKFVIKTGGASYECQMFADRATYERTKPVRTNTGDANNPASSSASSVYSQ